MVNPPRFARDRFTWLGYAMIGYYSYYIAALGPIVPFLRAEFNLSYFMSGLHLSALAGGVACIGLMIETVVARWGRPRALWSGTIGVALGTLGLIVAPSVWLTLPIIFFTGLSGGVLLILSQAMLADHHGTLRTRALSEANVLASVTSLAAPLLIGSFQRTSITWRGGLLILVLGFLLMYVAGRSAPMPRESSTMDQITQPTRLPRIFWLFWLLIFLFVAIEWCTLFWASSFLSEVVGLSATDAATAVSVFLVAMLLGRIVGSALTQRVATVWLLLAALLILAVGFPIFWLATYPPLNIAGLFLAGLGAANLYPLGLALAMSTVPQQANSASARITSGANMAILVLPFVLGWVADEIGILRAYGIVLGLVVGALLVLGLTQWATLRIQRVPA